MMCLFVCVSAQCAYLWHEVCTWGVVHTDRWCVWRSWCCDGSTRHTPWRSYRGPNAGVWFRPPMWYFIHIIQHTHKGVPRKPIPAFIITLAQHIWQHLWYWYNARRPQPQDGACRTRNSDRRSTPSKRPAECSRAMRRLHAPSRIGHIRSRWGKTHPGGLRQPVSCTVGRNVELQARLLIWISASIQLSLICVVLESGAQLQHIVYLPRCTGGKVFTHKSAARTNRHGIRCNVFVMWCLNGVVV